MYVAARMSATTGVLQSAAGVRVSTIAHAEVAIALAITGPQCTTDLSDSKTAILHYARNIVCAEAAGILRGMRASDRAIYIKWFPAHMGHDVSAKGNPNHNETVHSAARDLACRTAGNDCTDASESYDTGKEPLLAYSEILQWYRNSRRSMPPPHPGLTRTEAVLFRQLQTHSVLTPALARYICPEVYATDICRLCQEARATLVHLL